jgi:hypothetical protein
MSGRFGRFRAPWKLTGRELGAHAVFFVLNYALLAILPLGLYMLVSRINRSAGEGETA